MEMEVVLGIGEDAKPKACSSEIGSAPQQHDLGEKTLGDDSSTQENGVRVSENGEPKLNGSGVVVETKSLNGSGVIEDCVMNGVSSLLKLKNEEENEIDEDGEEEEEEDDDEEEEEEHGYYVGDFVWGKIKNHPWWPGQIYDPSDASELALKIKQKGKLLVAYFGDRTFAWCSPSQLKPFADSFKECSKVSNSRSFLGAVEEAVEEMGRHIERSLICDCAHKFDSPEAKNAGIKEGVVVHDVRRDMISSLLVGKPGEILEDVKGFAETVSFSGLLELEILKRKVSAFYRSKRGYGLSEYHEPQSVPGLEDKNKDDEDEKVDDGIKSPRGGAKRLGKEEDEKKEEVLDPEESLQRSLEKCSGFPDHRLHHRRKQKSIAEILDNESAAKVSFGAEPADGNKKSGRKKVKRGDEGSELENVTTTTPKSRRVSEISAIKDAGHKKVEDNEKGKTLSRKKKTKKKNNADDKDDDESGDREETEKNEVRDEDIDMDSTPLASLRKRVRVDASSVEKTAGDGDTAILSSKRERKKSKYFSPEFLSNFSWKGRKKSKNESESSKVSSQSQVGEQMTDASDSLMVEKEDKLDTPCEPALDNGLGQQELSEELSNAVDFLRLGASPKEMRDLIRVAALGTQYPKDSSSRDMVREFMSIYRSFTFDDGANKKFLGSYNISDKEKEELNETGKAETKGEERKEKKLKAKQQTEETEQIGKEENETEKHGTTKKERKQKKPKSKKQGDEEEETLKESSASAKKEGKQKKPKSKKQGDEEEETLKESSASAKKERKQKKPKSKQRGDEEEETLKESSASAKKERKRKKPESKKQADEEEETRKESSETTKKERKRKKRESKEQADDEEETLKELSETRKKERKRKKPQNEEEKTLNETEKPEKKRKKREGKSKKQKVDNEKIETEKAFSGAELFVTFGPGSSLPKKEELIEIYEKFGALDEERTYMSLNNFCARVAFLNITDGEKAFESSTVKCPFTCTSTVKFRLKYPNERTEEKIAEVAEKTVEMEYVKKKLEEMRLLVDECEGVMSEEVKVKLEDEMVNLLEQVRKMKSC